jgi:hypothetical protein
MRKEPRAAGRGMERSRGIEEEVRMKEEASMEVSRSRGVKVMVASRGREVWGGSMDMVREIPERLAVKLNGFTVAGAMLTEGER